MELCNIIQIKERKPDYSPQRVEMLGYLPTGLPIRASSIMENYARKMDGTIDIIAYEKTVNRLRTISNKLSKATSTSKNLLPFLGLESVVENGKEIDNALVHINIEGALNVGKELSKKTLNEFCTDQGIAKLQLVNDLYCGIGALHSNGIIHRDIKPDNILFDGRFLLYDYNLSAEDSSKVEISGTLTHLSPDIFYSLDSDSKLTTSKEDDYYSLGVVLAELYLGKPLYEVSKAVKQVGTNAIFDTMGIARLHMESYTNSTLTCLTEEARGLLLSDKYVDLELGSIIIGLNSYFAEKRKEAFEALGKYLATQNNQSNLALV